LKYGLTGALLNIIALTVLIQIEGNPMISSMLAGIVVIILFTFFAIKEFRDVHNQKLLHFWQGLILGMATYLIIAAISSSYYYIYISYIDTDVLLEIKQIQREFLEVNKDSMIEQRGEEWYNESYLMVDDITAANQTWGDFFQKALAGIFVTIIISVILRKVPQAYI
jgi:putative flippase GtrA